jgi:hypothetical protein
VRFWNDQVLCDTESVINAIWNALHAGPPSPCPLPPAGEGSEASTRSNVFKLYTAIFSRK